LATLKYHHPGIPTNQKRDNETFLEDFKVHASGYESGPYKIEWMRFEKNFRTPKLVKTIPRVAFEVDDLNDAIKEKEILIEPIYPSPGVTLALIINNGAPVEFLLPHESIAKDY